MVIFLPFSVTPACPGGVGRFALFPCASTKDASAITTTAIFAKRIIAPLPSEKLTRERLHETRRACRSSTLYNVEMTAFDDHRDELERYEFMMGVPRGRLAVTMDLLTDALAYVGQHGVYCQSARQLGKPAMDIQIIMKNMTDAKALIQSVMAELEKAKT